MKSYLYIALFLICSKSFSQVFHEPCNYADTLDLVGKVHSTDSVWTQIAAAAGTGPNVRLSDTVLSLPGYNGSGGKTIFTQFPTSSTNSGQSAGIRFATNAPYYLPTGSTGTVYVSFLVNLSRTTSTSLAFMSLHVTTGTYRARIVARRGSPATSFRFGIGHQSTANSNAFTGATADSTFPQNAVHLLVVKYIKTPTGASDTMKLYVFPAAEGVPPATEPEVADAVYFETASFIKPDINGIGLYQPGGGNTTGDPTRIYIDDIRVSNTWTTSVALPVKLISFQGRTTEEGNVLHWVTANERNNKYFQVQRSTNGTDFTTIGTVNGVAQSSAEKTYTYTDKSPVAGTNFYRLQQVDIDGKTQASSIITIQNRTLLQPITVTTTPAGLNLQIVAEKTSAATLQVVDGSGRVLLVRKMDLHTGNNSLYIPANLHTGIYTANIITENQNSTTRFFFP